MTGAAPRAAAAAVLGDRARPDAPLGLRTTYRVGGTAALLVEAESDADLALVARAVAESGLPVLVVGRGSNLLVADAGFAGIAVVLGDAFAGVEIAGTRVRAGGSCSLPVLARRTASAGLTGLEWGVGVPGSVGGAVRMNAGGHGSDTAATLVRVRVLDLASGEDEEVPAGALELSYRYSTLRPEQIVVWAEHALGEGDAATSEALISEIVRWRRDNQPGGQNAGSVFTNPPDDSAGRLVDACGLKGLRVGTAEVSEKHANFIQADPDGSADDVLALVREVRRRVRERTGVTLDPELRLIGFVPGDPHTRPDLDAP